MQGLFYFPNQSYNKEKIQWLEIQVTKNYRKGCKGIFVFL
jgi:hypothetical protein